MECIICTDMLSRHLFPQRKITGACQHEPKICLKCLARSIEKDLQNRDLNQIRCPSCLETLSYRDIESFATQDTFKRYDKLVAQRAMESLPNFRWCLGRGCSSGQVHPMGDAEPIMTCPSCAFQTCFVHQMPWHQGRSCEEWDNKKNSQDIMSIKVIQETTKHCPNTNCGWRIEKSGGCDHMTCSRCKSEFCWECLAPYRSILQEDNARHARGCKYHTDNLGVRPRDTESDTEVIATARAGNLNDHPRGTVAIAAVGLVTLMSKGVRFLRSFCGHRIQLMRRAERGQQRTRLSRRAMLRASLNIGPQTAIVYDSTEGKLYRVPEIEAEGYLRAIVPGKHMKADLYLELGNERQAWLARVDLGNLGWTVKLKRFNGEIKYVYLKTGNI